MATDIRGQGKLVHPDPLEPQDALGLVPKELDSGEPERAEMGAKRPISASYCKRIDKYFP